MVNEFRNNRCKVVSLVFSNSNLSEMNYTLFNIQLTISRCLLYLVLKLFNRQCHRPTDRSVIQSGWKRKRQNKFTKLQILWAGGLSTQKVGSSSITPFGASWIVSSYVACNVDGNNSDTIQLGHSSKWCLRTARCNYCLKMPSLPTFDDMRANFPTLDSIDNPFTHLTR